MNIENYFRDLTAELDSLKDRVRHFIGDAHWLSDGELKESVLRTILRRYLPSNIGVGRGFVVNLEETSTQIDVLLYDKTKPILFQDGDFVIITKDSVRGAIEVKTKFWQPNKLREAINKISNIAEFVNPTSTYGKKHFFGLFSYEATSFNTDNVLDILQDCVEGRHQRVIHCVSCGKHYFVRYWPFPPDSPNIQNHNMWHAYLLENKSPAYFVHNVIDHLCPEWANDNNSVWYPEDGKENHKVGEKFLYLPHQVE